VRGVSEAVFSVPLTLQIAEADGAAKEWPLLKSMRRMLCLDLISALNYPMN
jgi:hypothetical protein